MGYVHPLAFPYYPPILGFMLSVSRLLEGPDIKGAHPARSTGPQAPVVVWNITRRCALRCAHCYSGSSNNVYAGELSTVECVRLVDDLAAFRVPAIIFSGGDPLLREDIFTVMRYAADSGIRAVLSTNGVGIDRYSARLIKEAGVAYAGVSLDGGPIVNDRVRGIEGGFNQAVAAIRLLKELGITVGVRFTMTAETIGELPFIFDLIEKEGIDRGYFSHLVPAGRGEKFFTHALPRPETRKAIDYIFERAAGFAQNGLRKDIVTGSNDADGVYLYLRLKESDPAKAMALHRILKARGGNSAGVSLGSVDNTGAVRPDQFWEGASAGDVRKARFSTIWSEGPGILRALRNRAAYIKGRCSGCRHFGICGGSNRVRAGYATGDIWASDPGCYLTDEEIGLSRKKTDSFHAFSSSKTSPPTGI